MPPAGSMIEQLPRQSECGVQSTDSIPTPLSDDHSRVEPPLPIPNRTVKRSRANDSRLPPVKVGHRQTPYNALNTQPKPLPQQEGFFIAQMKENKNGAARAVDITEVVGNAM